MKTTLELPDELLMEIKLRAVRERKKLKDAVAELLRKGLTVQNTGAGLVVKVDKAMMKRRKEMVEKVLSGELGLELTGFEEAQEYDRQKDIERAKAWRD